MKNLLVVIGVSLILAAGGAYAQSKIYKTTDKDGNTVYTDQPPPEGSVPMDLPELSIVSPRENQKSVQHLDVNRRGGAGAKGSALPPREELLQTYSDMEISTPNNDETIWGTGSAINVGVDLKTSLLSVLFVQLTYDGRKLPRQKSTSIQLDQVERGEHTVQAEVVNGEGQVFGRTDPVKFFMRQHSVNFNRPAPGTG